MQGYSAQPPQQPYPQQGYGAPGYGMYGGPGIDPQVAQARMQSYTSKAVIALVLYFVLWIPGLIANILFYSEAKRMERIAGNSLPGAGCLFWQLVIVGAGFAVMFLFIVVILGAAAGA